MARTPTSGTAAARRLGAALVCLGLLALGGLWLHHVHAHGESQPDTRITAGPSPGSDPPDTGSRDAARGGSIVTEIFSGLSGLVTAVGAMLWGVARVIEARNRSPSRHRR